MAFPYCATCFGRCYPNGAALILERKSMIESINQLFIVSPVRGLKRSSDSAEMANATENGDALAEKKAAIVADGE